MSPSQKLCIVELMDLSKPVLFFDETCNLCNTMIDLVVKLDKDQRVFKAPLQGQTAKESLPEEKRQSLRTLILLKNDQLFVRSSAIFQLALIIKGPLLILLPFWILPRFITDFFYILMAKYRYRLFGRRETGRVLSEDEKGHFLH